MELLPALALAASLAACTGSGPPADAIPEPAPHAAESAPTRPNLIVVVTDDQRFDQMSCAGHPVLRTPVMDGLAAEGVRFTEAFVTTAICAASRATILTGRREGRHGYTFGTPPMGPDLAAESYPMQLRAAGYRTGFVGKWGVRFAKGAMTDAFDERHTPWYPYVDEGRPHLTDHIGDLAVDFVRREDDRPFCLSISFHAPHAEDSNPDQYIPPPDLEGLYADAAVAPPPLADEGFEALPGFLKESMGRKRWHWRFDTREKQIERTRDYWRLVSGVDRALGRVLAAVEAAGEADDTVVVLIGDNGYFLGERGLAGKWFIYEESIRVPLIVMDPRAPKARRGVTEDAMVLNTDVAPTLLSLAGLPVPAGHDGRDLGPLLRGEEPAWRSDFLYEHLLDNEQIPKSVGVRGERYVYARYFEEEPVFEQLFDLELDPDQLRDLARDPEHVGTLERMRARCDELGGR